MTLDEAYEITSKMTPYNDRYPTDIQREAKWLIYEKIIRPKYADKDGNVPSYLEPDAEEEWET